MRAKTTNIISCSYDTLRSLNRRQQKAGKEIRATIGDTIEAEVIADPRRCECVDGMPKRTGLLLIEGAVGAKGKVTL